MAVVTDYLGKGIKFPFQINENGGVAMSSGEEHLAEGLRHLLSTKLRERVMRRDFGSRLHEVVWEPNDDGVYNLLKRFVIEAARTWERRLLINEVAIMPEFKNNLVRVRIDFVILKNNREGNLVFPFYLHESKNV